MKKILSKVQFSIAPVDTNLHAYFGYSDGKYPFENEEGNRNMVWNRDSSIVDLLKAGAQGSEAHGCSAFDANIPVTTKEIVDSLGGHESIIEDYLFDYKNIEQLVSHSPSYRRWTRDTLSSTKEEMNLFFTLGKNNELCVVGISFKSFPYSHYHTFAKKVVPVKKKLSFFTRKEKSWPAGTRIFLRGAPSLVFHGRALDEFSSAYKEYKNQISSFFGNVFPIENV